MTVFIRHTSASLIIYENADPSARADLHGYFERIVPEDGDYAHTLERPDDTTSHLRMALTRTSEEMQRLGIGVIDIKVNHAETHEEVARRIEKVVRKTGDGGVKWVHPDCGFWMLNRSIADRKLDALVRGRDTFLGI